jgi:hypothetical protein
MLAQARCGEKYSVNPASCGSIHRNRRYLPRSAALWSQRGDARIILPNLRLSFSPAAAAKKNAPQQNMIWQQTHRRGPLRSGIIAIFAEHSTLISGRTIIL